MLTSALSERTRKGLDSSRQQGVKLGKPKGALQRSIYDPDQERIRQLYALGAPLSVMVRVHLGYGKYFSLKTYIDKRKAAWQKSH